MASASTTGATTPDDERSIENEYPELIDESTPSVLAVRAANAIGFFSTVEGVEDAHGDKFGDLVIVRAGHYKDCIEEWLEQDGMTVDTVFPGDGVLRIWVEEDHADED